MSARRTRYLGAAALALLLVIASGAQAKTFSGVVPDVPTGHHPAPLARIAGNLPYSGGPVMHVNRTHLVFWQPRGSSLAYDPGYQAQFETFLTRVAQDSRKTTDVYSLSGQYGDGSGAAAYNSTYAGAVLATDPLPTNGCSEPPPPPLAEGPPGWNVCLTDAQLQAELSRVVAADHLPRTFRDIYFLVTPNGFGNCEDNTSSSCALGGSGTGYCGYHSSDPEGRLLYAIIPYNAVVGHCQSGNPRPNGSTADPALSTLSHEHSETVTDPLYFDPAWIDNGSENGDKCISDYGSPLGGSGTSRYNQVIRGAHYYLQEEWSNQNGGCAQRAAADSVWFAPPTQARALARLTLTAHARAPNGSVTAYNWFFGDHGTGRHRVVMHTFSRPGSYQVVLRITDNWGNWAYAARTVKVNNAKAPRKRNRRRR